jgi:hypothetical protein
MSFQVAQVQGKKPVTKCEDDDKDSKKEREHVVMIPAFLHHVKDQQTRSGFSRRMLKPKKQGVPMIANESFSRRCGIETPL